MQTKTYDQKVSGQYSPHSDNRICLLFYATPFKVDPLGLDTVNPAIVLLLKMFFNVLCPELPRYIYLCMN
jgi:hypothetical protein